MKYIATNSERGFALVTGLLMLLVLTLLATVVMRGTTLELAMTTAVTRQEQALSLADSARSLTRELFVAANARDNAMEGNVQSKAVIPRPANVPKFVGAISPASCSASQSFDALGAGERQGVEGTGNQIRFRGVADESEKAKGLRIQTLNSVPPHINPLHEARSSCESGKMGMAIIDLNRKVAEGADITNPEIIKTVALVGFGDQVGGGSAKTVTISDVQIQ